MAGDRGVGVKTITEPFRGGTAVVTGAGSGLGEALGRRAAALGMQVVLADVAADRVERVAAELKAAGHEVLPVVVDVGDADSVDRLAAITFERFGAVRLLVSNAGIHAHGLLWDVPAEVFARVFRVNVSGFFHCARAFVPRMLESGEPGFVVSVASNAMAVSTSYQGAYTASKHAVQSLAECLYLDLREAGASIAVSTVVPNAIATRIHEDAPAFDEVGAERLTRARLALRDHGIEPAAAAETILDQVAAGSFWVLTHPDSTQAALRQRAEMLTGLKAPSPPSAT